VAFLRVGPWQGPSRFSKEGNPGGLGLGPSRGLAPDAEAPADMFFYIPKYKALSTAEDPVHTRHVHRLGGAKVRSAYNWAKDPKLANARRSGNGLPVHDQSRW